MGRNGLPALPGHAQRGGEVGCRPHRGDGSDRASQRLGRTLLQQLGAAEHARVARKRYSGVFPGGVRQQVDDVRGAGEHVAVIACAFGNLLQQAFGADKHIRREQGLAGCGGYVVGIAGAHPYQPEGPHALAS